MAFATIQVPDVANGLAEAQTSIVYYDDGKTEMARIAELDREPLPLASIPKHLQHAVIAAEDRDFYTNAGISPTGIARPSGRPSAAATSRVAGRRSPSNT
ncbi:MAG: transglycosylase domain-containing protein [Actinomycetales bacterium]|uniref:Transglycosylase domain-containing protein n=1 Tax=Candidatus Phosphoribacter hodrii TaxID=2953743 RepID=A0A9D7XXE9_9MICO|nr:transglycosylase domain-containing protein [Candidatus Phosphoribacter hodrii]